MKQLVIILLVIIGQTACDNATVDPPLPNFFEDIEYRNGYWVLTNYSRPDTFQFVDEWNLIRRHFDPKYDPNHFKYKFENENTKLSYWIEGIDDTTRRNITFDAESEFFTLDASNPQGDTTFILTYEKIW